MTYLEADGTSYVSWSYRKGIGTPNDTGSMLYIASIDPANPYVITSKPVLLSRPLFGWENLSGTINNEGSYPLITDDYIYLVYSGGAAGGYTYALGVLRIRRGENLLNPAKWEKFCAPVMSYYSVKGEYGPGHNSFYTDEFGNIMNVYHYQQSAARSPRLNAIRRVHFNKDGFPVFSMSPDRDLNKNIADVTINVTIRRTT
jgi:GH43 family beta-xylosidase